MGMGLLLMIQHDLPLQPTAFVGRTHELADILKLLDTPDCRLLTLVGPGGMGKTRLSLEIASTILNHNTGESRDLPIKALFSNGVFFVPLQPLGSDDGIVSALAEAVGLQFYAGDESQQQLIDYLRPKALLLILDNFEHLLENADLVADLLANAPKIKILVTSRETLNLREEWVYQLKGMQFPEEGTDVKDIADADSYSAVQLFTQSARRARPEFLLSAEQNAVLRICRLVEGMPLALEMTAAWLRRLPAEEIAQQLERGLDILESPARNVEPRHRSIRAVFEHSWNLLTNVEQQVFAKLSVFRSGFRREAAEAITGATLALLSSLVDKSLLHVDSVGRYSLHELLRQYAEEKLSPEESWQAHDDHCTYYMDFLARREDAMMMHMSRVVVAEITSELKNVRAAVDWAIDHRENDDLGINVEKSTNALACLTLFYQFRCLFEEGEEVCERMVKRARNSSPGEMLARMLTMQGWFVELRSQDFGKAKTIFEEALHLARVLGVGYCIGDVLLRLSDLTAQQGNYAQARQLAKESLEFERLYADEWSHTFILSHLGYVTFLLGEYQEARTLLQGAIEIAEKYDVPTGIADGRNYLGQVELALQMYHDAKQTFVENLAYSKQAVYLKGTVLSLIGAGEATHKLGEYSESRQHLSEALKTALESNQIPYLLHALTATADLLVQNNNLEHALGILTVVLDHRAASHGTRTHANHLFSQIESRLSPEVVAAAVEYAKSTPLEKIVQDLQAQVLSAQSERPITSAIPAMSTNALTEREIEILRLLADGLSNREIAEQLFLATGTVKWYLGEIYSKLYVTSRTQAIARARELNLLS
jgi:predicted ATPase/DNA-binding NarL/FixJ family response regulator